MSTEDKFDADKFSENLRDKIHQDIHDRIHEQAQSQFRNVRPGSVQLHFGGRSAGLWPGVILVIVGTVVLLDHMHIFPAEMLWRFWPVLLIVFGGFKFFEPHSRLLGAVAVVAGALLLLNNLNIARFSWWDIWPIALICAGLLLIWSRFEVPKLPPVPSSAGPNAINEFALFGGVERRISVPNFAGGTVTATFGGVELDFRSADIEGEQAVLYIEALFGGIEVTVPDRWIVAYEGQSIFGGYSDETRPPLPDVPGGPARKRLVLRGRAIFGGISVKN